MGDVDARVDPTGGRSRCRTLMRAPDAVPITAPGQQVFEAMMRELALSQGR